jgi:omega-6 fatty acid desaturase (delta-12 desaturase)
MTVATGLIQETAAEVPSLDALRAHVARYEAPDTRKAWLAFATSLPPFVMCWWAMYELLEVSYMLTLLLAFPTAGFLVRTFIVQHDCGHGTFFRSRRLRTFVGRLCAPITLLPYGYFRHFHGAHHAHSGNLDKRGADIETMTVREYNALPPSGRFRYRLLRHPVVLFGIGPLVYFGIMMRIPAIAPAHWKRERRSIMHSNLVLLILVAAMIWWVGARAFLLVQLPITLIASTVGMWLFYVQHQFEDTYWEDGSDWDYRLAALRGSSFYALPPLLSWFTGYIGYHHIHHLSPRVPSYRLVQCHRETVMFSRVPRITLVDSLRCARLALWDEESRRLVSFSVAQRTT